MKTENFQYIELIFVSGYETFAEMIANKIMERIAESIVLTGIRSFTSAGRNDRVIAVETTEAIAEAISKILADFIEINKSEIEFESMKRMKNAEPVSFIKSVLLLLSISA